MADKRTMTLNLTQPEMKALEQLAQTLDRACVLLLLLERLPVVLEHDRVDEVPPRAPRARVDELLRAAAIPPETRRDEREQAQPEEKAALSLEAGLAQQVGEGSVGHGVARAGALIVPARESRPKADSRRLGAARATCGPVTP